MRKITKRAAIIGGVICLAAGGGVAWAAWTSSAEGPGTVTSTQPLESHITPAGNGTPLYPGATTTFTVTVDNPNSYPVRVTAISAGASNEVGGCAAGSVVSDAVTPAAATIAAGGSGVYTLTARMIADPADACAGKTFTLPLSAQLVSAA